MKFNGLMIYSFKCFKNRTLASKKRPRASSGGQRKAKVTPTSQYFSTKHPYRIYRFKSSAKTARKMHQNPTAHNSWTPQTTAFSTQRTSTSESKRVKTSALLQQKSKRPTPVTVHMRPFTVNGKTWDKGTVAKTGWAIIPSHDRRCILPVKRVDLRKTQERSQPDTSSIKRREVDSGNGSHKPQPLCQPASMSLYNNHKSCSTQMTTARPHSKKLELGCPNKPVTPTSVSVPTETRPRRAAHEPAYLKDYIRNRTVNSCFTNIESKRQIPRKRTWLRTISLLFS